jgi:hypothetical protein
LAEDSYLSRFLAKFVEIIAAGLATAVSAYLIAHVAGPLSATMPAPATVGPSPVAPDLLKSPPARSAAPVTAAANEEPRSVAQPSADVPPLQPARKTTKTATSEPVPPSKDGKGSTNASHGERSAEALARAALANLDAERAPADAPFRSVSIANSPAAAVPVEVRARPAEPPARQAETPPLATVETAPPHTATVDPPPPSASPPEGAGPQPQRPADEANGLLSVPKRILDLMRPGTPSLADEAPRPPMPIATAPRGG